MQHLRIIFFGTPGFAVISLKTLLDAGCNVVAVVTAPDKPAGRGLQAQQSAVKVFAEQQGIPVLQPPKLKAPDFLESLRSYQADLQVIVAFRMLPEVVWNMPPLGTVNVHASLLPQYRGAAPINWAIINGEQETGVTTFRLQQEIDTGNILLQEATKIEQDETAGSLHDRLAASGAALLVKTVAGLAAGTIEAKPQPADQGELRHAPKLFKPDMVINWQQSAARIDCFIRGLAPYPAATTTIQGKNLKVFSATTGEDAGGAQPGSFETDGKSLLRFAATDRWINLEEVQLEGKKRMPVADFLRGFRPEAAQ